VNPQLDVSAIPGVREDEVVRLHQQRITTTQDLWKELVPVAALPLRAGAMVRAGDIAEVPLPMQPSYVRDRGLLVGTMLQRGVRARQPFRSTDLLRPQVGFHRYRVEHRYPAERSRDGMDDLHPVGSHADRGRRQQEDVDRGAEGPDARVCVSRAGPYAKREVAGRGRGPVTSRYRTDPRTDPDCRIPPGSIPSCDALASRWSCCTWSISASILMAIGIRRFACTTGSGCTSLTQAPRE
jgi:hypothetical protein